ncbi:MAG: DUF6144 family protein, partial [bacterium]
VDNTTRDGIMAGSEVLSDGSARQQVIDWSKQAMDRMDESIDEAKRIAIMTRCACQYPKADLQEIKRKYQTTQDIDLVHNMLQEKFVSFLKHKLQLDDDVVDELVNRGMGLAGKRQGNTIIATKIPKSGYILEYLAAKDPVKKRAIYCHCPRIRDALKANIEISATYCYCGAGYYKGIWEEILQRPVKVELLESVLKGDDACKIAIHLPL